MTDKEVAGRLIQAKMRSEAKYYNDWGLKIGQLYTDHGLPIDIGLAELNKRFKMTEEQELCVIDGACEWLIQHKRNSGATEKAIERQRKTNREMLRSFLTKGETGAY